MLRKITIVLWSLVLVAGAWWVYNKRLQVESIVETDLQRDGRVFDKTPWKHFVSIPPFTLTDQNDTQFQSESLAGRPYVVSFFFTSCPTICRDLNRQIKRLTEQFQNTGLAFLSITVDPENDTPDVLQSYASDFDSISGQWRFLTGPLHRVQQIGKLYFDVIVDGENHTGDILLVDRWGRYRDRFTWNDPREMKRFAEVARQLLDETKPPIDAEFQTRNVLAGIPHQQLPNVSFLFDFHLTDQHNRPFFSRDLTGQVWIASFFFSSCPGICPRQNKFLASIQDRLADHNAKLVSITTDPQTDDPIKLRQYARQIDAGDHWTFLTGSLNYIRRIGSEFLRLAGDGEHHSSLLAVIDRWGNVRARIDWQRPGSKPLLLDLVDQLNAETLPPSSFELIEMEASED